MPTVAILLLTAVAAALTARVVALHRRLREAEAAMSRRGTNFLITSLSHELRTPLTAMIGFAEVARQPSLEEDRRAECLERMIANGHRLVRLVNDVFDTAKLQEGRLAVHAIDCRLDDVLDEATAAIRAEADKKGLLVAARVDDDVPQQVRLDPTRVAQVLRLVLENGVKFTRRGHVGVRVERRGAELAFRVHDTGPGVEKKAQSGLFQTGRTGDQTDARRQGGVGLGLSLASGLAERLGGRLLHDASERNGTTFTLLIPFVPAQSTPDPQRALAGDSDVGNAAGTTPARFAGRALIVEDGRDNQLLIRHVLRQFGVECDVAENGRIAVRTLESKPYDLVLMDMQMPILDGYQATEQIRAHGSRVPIIALTAHALSGERERCLAAGCDEFLTKPLDRKRLGRALGRFLRSAAD